jgi:hypothetical protein
LEEEARTSDADPASGDEKEFSFGGFREFLKPRCGDLFFIGNKILCVLPSWTGEDINKIYN